MSESYEKLRQDQLKAGIWAPSSDKSNDFIPSMIERIKTELSDHCMKLMERMDSCHEIEKKELTKHADNEIKRIYKTLSFENIH